MSHLIILGICGEFCSGKSTVAQMLKDNFNFVICENNSLMDFELNIEISDSQTNSINHKKSIREKLREIKHKLIVITPFNEYESYLEFTNKTPFRLINITSPAKNRYQNYLKKYSNKTFEDFLEQDYIQFTQKDFKKLQSKAYINIENNSSVENLCEKISSLIFSLSNFFRPCWDDYFMCVAHIVSNRSNCIKQKVGAVIVKDNRIICTGYNGTPSKLLNCFEGECPRCNDDTSKQGENLDKCFCIHAEENAVLESGRTLCKNATLYSTVYPCLLCSKMIIECGIIKVVYDKEYNSEFTDIIMKKADIHVSKWKKQVDEFI